MCLSIPKPQVQPVIDPQAAQNAAANALIVGRKGAQSFQSSILGGMAQMQNQPPPLARQMLLGGMGTGS